jgi:hypothetical protein
MQPELKRRVEEAARREEMTRNEWVLTAIEAILKVQELHAETDEEIEAIGHKLNAKFEEMLALLAGQQKLGDLATLAGKSRTKLEAMADHELEKWRFQELRYGTSAPKTKLERLCKEYRDLAEEIRCIRDGQTNREFIERMEREHFPDWDEDE